MDNIKSRKISYNIIIRLLSVFFVYSSALYFFSFITADPDLWGHITFGKEIWTSRAIPHFDIYSYTAYGMAWINHEWISEVLMWLTFNTSGSPGFLIIKVLIGFIAVSAVFAVSSYRKSHHLINGIVLVTAVFIMSPGFMIRPQLATMLFTPIFFLLLHFYLERRINLLWILPFVMVLWVNSHGGFMIGAGAFPLIVIFEYIDCFVKGKDHSHMRSLVLWMIVTEATLLFNPYGVHLLVFLYRTITLDRSITEWAPVSLFDLSYVRFKIFSLAVIVCFFIDRRKNRYWEVAIIVIAMIFAFLHQRHTPVLAIFAAPLISEKLTGLMNRTRFDEFVWSSYSYTALIIAFALIIGFQIFGTFKKYVSNGFNIIVDPYVYPTGAIRFLKTNNIMGDILVPFDWGEDVIWNLPECKVSIDGRFDTVYPEDVINAHFNAIKSEDEWNYLIKKYPADIILARRNSYSVNMINSQDDWIYVYSDKVSIVYLRNDQKNSEIDRRFRDKGYIYPDKDISVYFP